MLKPAGLGLIQNFIKCYICHCNPSWIQCRIIQQQKSGLRTKKFNLIKRKSPYSCHPIVMREVTADVHIQFQSTHNHCFIIDLDFFFFFFQWSKRKPWNTIITSISRRNTEDQVVLFPSGTSHFTSKNLLVSLMLPLRFWRDLVLENYTEDLASKTLGQPGVLYDG